MKRGILFACALVFACGGEGDDGDESFTCDPRREGTYRLSFTTVDGNCGDQAGGVDRLDNAAPLPAGCSLVEGDVWSSDGCKLERSLECAADAIGPGFTTDTVAVTTQKSASLITGILTMNVYDAGGQLACTGTYNLRAERL